ncbi:MAG: hypothetical protein LBM98_06275 [Oscillospiraceae bacterium]|jgi:molybdate transport repressor ModE-like protein|nr:hypothetical protein [Oscillospiraceae bacterium]
MFIANSGKFAPLYKKAVEIECGDLGAISDVSQSETDLQSLYDNSELRNVLRPITRYCLGFEERFFGPVTVHLIELIEESENITKAVDTMGMSYQTFVVIHERIESALGIDIVKNIGGEKKYAKFIVTDEAKELVTRYKSYVKDFDAYEQECFDRYFGGYGWTKK